MQLPKYRGHGASFLEFEGSEGLAVETLMYSSVQENYYQELNVTNWQTD